MAVTHLFESLVPDGDDETQVRSSDWNAAHVLSNALKAIDGLTPAASKILYFTGAAAATLTDITATGISLLGAADAAAGRTALGLGTIATQAASNVSLTGGSISGMTSIGGVLLSLASDSGAEHVFCKTNDTSNSNQSCVFALRHYSSASEESATAFRMVSESGVNQLYLGGGALNHNACTMIKFYTASNNTTLGGTERGSVTNGGRLLWGTTTDDGVSKAQINGTIKATGYKTATYNFTADYINASTSDGSDNSFLIINGGGSNADASRGSFIGVYGNEVATNGGCIFLTTGNVATGNINFRTGASATRMQINNAGRILMGTTLPTDDGVNALQLNGTLASKGVKLDGTASSDVNTLDYYKEGTFTPVLYGLTTAGEGTYTVQTGKYTRIGNTVNITIYLTWSAHTGTGDMRISGLPFASAGYASLSNYHNGLSVGSGKVLGTYTGDSVSYVYLMAMDPTGASSGPVPMDTTGTLLISGTYFV